MFVASWNMTSLLNLGLAWPDDDIRRLSFCSRQTYIGFKDKNLPKINLRAALLN